MVTGGIEAVGDAMTGGILARAVEPAHGEATATERGACLNCGFELIGPHCHGCGQKAQVHRTLRSYGHDLLHGVFHFEGKVWKTLPMLAFKPGELTRRYIHGERAKFVSPLALFLFAVFLMFAVVGSLAGAMHLPNGTVQTNLKGKPLSELQTALKAEQAKKAELDARIKALDATDGNPASLYADRSKAEENIGGIETAIRFVEKKAPIFTDIKTGIPRIDAGIAAANENPSLMLYKLQSSAYKYSWALIPLSLPFVWLMFFWKRGYKLYDHAVFVTYSLTFMLFLIVVLTTANAAGVGEPFVPLAAVFVPPLHIYRQIRGAYRASRVGAILRTAVLSFCGVVVLILFVALLLLLGVLG